jgi:hypothetical protein
MNFGGGFSGLGVSINASTNATRSMGMTMSSRRGGYGNGNNNNHENLEVGKWYLIDYCYKKIKAKCICSDDTWVLMKFYWGAPYRTRQLVSLCDVISETTKPKWYSNK